MHYIHVPICFLNLALSHFYCVDEPVLLPPVLLVCMVTSDGKEFDLLTQEVGV